MSDMQATLTDTSRRRPGDARFLGDLYIVLLGIVLLGYAVMGKGFAYLGFPPLYVGEIALLGGAVVFLRTGAGVGAMATMPAVLLLTLIGLVLSRTFPFLGMYGFDALRDSVVVIYGGFAFIVIGLLLEDARRIDIVLGHYRIMLASLPAIFVASLLVKYWSDDIPVLFGPVPIVDTGPSAVGTHLAGAMVFVLIGYSRVSLAWFAVWLATLGLVSATNRGAMLAAIVPVAIAMLALGRYCLILASVVVTVGVFGALLALETAFGHFEEAKDSINRPVSAHQIVENAKSIVEQSGRQGEGTKQWRLNWWDIIINDTVYGPNFWTGRGFGLNLADADGFAGTQEGPPTRSPHNAHMTILARVGIPGLVLWLLLLASWFITMTRAILTARAQEDERWAELFIFIVCYELAILINATFDVALEGPMQGVWFWCLFGLGVGSVMIYRAQLFSEHGRRV